MAVYDRWHKSHPKLDGPDPDRPCKCGRGKNKLYPTSDHLKGRRWQVRWADDEGNKLRRNFEHRGGHRDETDPKVYAAAFDAQITSDLNADNYTDPAAGQATLADFAKQWRAGLVADLTTLENIDQRLAHIINVEPGPRSRRAPGASKIAAMPMAKLAKNPSAVQQWIKSLQGKGLSPAYIGQIVDLLSTIFIAAIDNGAARSNPTRARSVTLPPPDQSVIEPWTPTMVAAARTKLEAALGVGAMADLGAGAGLRQGEIFGLATTDIEFLGNNRRIKVRRQVKMVTKDGHRALVFAPPKRGKERDIELSDALGRRLAAHIKAHPPVEVTLPWKVPGGKRVTALLLFVRADGRPWHRQAFSYHWHKARDAAGAEAARENGMHALRHTYASLQLAAGVDVLKVSAWLGHSDPAFTWRVYGHFIPDSAGKGRAAVDAFLEPPGADTSALKVPSPSETQQLGQVEADV